MGIWYSIFTESNSCPSYIPGLYTAEQIDDLVFNQGYIPVANISELNALRNTTSQTMGLGTCWEGSYNTGLSGKNYIQVENIDGSSFGNWTSALSLDGVYDGNELAIGNLSQTTGLFNNFSLDEIELRNITCIGCTGTGAFVSFLLGAGRGYTIDNCRFVNCNITTTRNDAAIVMGIMGGLWKDSTISNVLIEASCSIVSSGLRTGGVAGGEISSTTYDAYFIDCENRANITGRQAVGGICGRGRNLHFIRCINSGDIKKSVSFNAGGICSWITAGTAEYTDCIVKDCTIEQTDSYTFANMSGIGALYYDSTMTGCLVENVTMKAVGSAPRRIGLLTGATTGAGTSLCEKNKIINCNIEGGRFAGAVIGQTLTNKTVAINDISCIGTTILNGNQSGGVVGYKGNNGYTFNRVVSAATFTGTQVSTGGFYGFSTAAVGSNDNYWDSDLQPLGGTSYAAKKTTAELKTPTTNSGIFSAYSIPPWDFGTATDYPQINL